MSRGRLAKLLKELIPSTRRCGASFVPGHALVTGRGCSTVAAPVLTRPPAQTWKPNRTVRKTPPLNTEGTVIWQLSHKDIKSLVNQAVDALKKASQWQAGQLTSGLMMHCLQSAAASRGKAFQLVRGQMFLAPKQNKVMLFTVEGFLGKVAAQLRESDWTILRNQELCYDERNCIVHELAGYKVGERNLGPDDVIAKIPVPQTSPTSYRAFLRTDYIRVRPDWVLSIVMEADKVARTFDRKGKRIRRPPFDVKSMKFQCLQEAGVPYLWVYNAWEARLQVWEHTTPHASGGQYRLEGIYELEGEKYDPQMRAPPFQEVDVNLRQALGWRKDRIRYA